MPPKMNCQPVKMMTGVVQFCDFIRTVPAPHNTAAPNSKSVPLNEAPSVVRPGPIRTSRPDSPIKKAQNPRERQSFSKEYRREIRGPKLHRIGNNCSAAGVDDHEAERNAKLKPANIAKTSQGRLPSFTFRDERAVPEDETADTNHGSGAAGHANDAKRPNREFGNSDFDRGKVDTPKDRDDADQSDGRSGWTGRLIARGRRHDVDPMAGGV